MSFAGSLAGMGWFPTGTRGSGNSGLILRARMPSMRSGNTIRLDSPPIQALVRLQANDVLGDAR